MRADAPGSLVEAQEAGEHQLPHAAAAARRAAPPASTSSSDAIASTSTPTGRSPSQAPTSAASPGRPRSVRAKPPPCRSSITLGASTPGQVVARFGDVGARRRGRMPRAPSSSSAASRSCAASASAQCDPSAVARVERLRQPLVAGERRRARRPAAAAARSRTRPRSHRARRSRRATRRRGPRTPAMPGSVPPSRIHSSAYDSGSSDSRSTTQASSGIGRRLDPRPRAVEPRLARRGSPSCRAAAQRRRARDARRRRDTKAATRSSPCMPPSRYSYAGTPARLAA